MPSTGDPTIALPEWELQQDIYSILSGNSTITTTYGATVYDEPPDNPSWPYIVIGQQTSNPQYYKTGALDNDVETIHIFSDYLGAKEVKQLADAISSALTGGTYSLSGFTVLQVSRDNFIVIREQFGGDRVIRHAILYMRFLIS